MRISDSSSDVCSSDLVAAAARPQRAAETDREAQHLDPVAARDPVVAELVEGHQQPEADDEPPQGSDEGAHAGGLMQACSCRRAHGVVKIGRAACRERVCQYVWISGDAESLTNTTKKK